MIFHAEKRQGFVMMDKAPLNDSALSLRAKGLLAYLLSKPPDWRPQVTDIAKHCKERPGAIRATLRELKEAGYAVLIQNSVSGGRYEGSEWTIHERCQKPAEIKEPAKTPEKTEIAVSRNSEKRHPNNNETTTKNERPKGARSVSYEDLRNYPDLKLLEMSERCRELFSNRPLLVAETIALIEGTAGIKKGHRFYSEWVKRATEAPHRVLYAITALEDDFALARTGGPRCPQIRNPSGRADWYFQNVNLDTHHLERGSRGKKHSKKAVEA